MTSATGTARQAEVQAYASAVRAALADVPADRSDELLDDLEEHLAEVAADDEAPLESRLGPPAAYARELRTAAGLPPGEESPADARGGYAELTDRLRSWEPVLQVEGFLPELRPAWWVVRAWAAVTAVDVVFVGSPSFPVPTLGLGPVGWLVTGAAVTWSVRQGLRARAEGRPAGRSAVLANAVLGVLTLVALIGLADRSDVASADPVPYDTAAPGALAHEDGTPITNILPYSSTGELLTGVLLYDQDGRPIDDLADATVDGDTVEQVPEARPQPGNAYPQHRQVLTWDDQGRQVIVPMPLPTAAPTPTAEAGPVAPGAPSAPGDPAATSSAAPSTP
jgi:hypothetical protein